MDIGKLKSMQISLNLGSNQFFCSSVSSTVLTPTPQKTVKKQPFCIIATILRKLQWLRHTYEVIIVV